MSNIKLFENKKVRTHWDENNERWYFSIVDIIAILTESASPQMYWRVMKKRLLSEGNETVTNCNALKMEAVYSGQGHLAISSYFCTLVIKKDFFFMPSQRVSKGIPSLTPNDRPSNFDFHD